MIAIIPAAGIGTRLRPHTHIYPKVLLNVAGKPIINYVIDSVVENDIKDIRMVIGYKEDQVKEYVRNYYKDLNIDFVIQKDFLGLGYAVNLALKDMQNEDTLIVLGDTIIDGSFSEIKDAEYSLLGLKEVDNPKRFGLAIVDSDNFVTELEEKPEKPRSNLALVGFYYIKNTARLRQALNQLEERDIRTKGEYQITDALQIMIEKKEKFKAHYMEGWYDCGKPETLLSTNRFLLSKKSREYEIEGSIVKFPSYLGDNIKIENSVVGPYCSISDGVRIENSIIINSIVGKNSEIKNIIVKDSIFGAYSRLSGDFFKINISDHSEIESKL